MAPGAVEGARDELAVARDALRAARLLLQSGLVNDAVSRLYYAAFHAARAALVVTGRSAKTHTGNATLFRQTFGPHPVLERLLQLRADADYGAGVKAPADQVAAIAGDVDDFLAACDSIVAAAASAGPDESDPPADR